MSFDIPTDMIVKCKRCNGDMIKTRKDKKFCSTACASAWHNKKRTQQVSEAQELHTKAAHYDDIKEYLTLSQVWDSLCSDVRNWVKQGRPTDLE